MEGVDREIGLWFSSTGRHEFCAANSSQGAESEGAASQAGHQAAVQGLDAPLKAPQPPRQQIAKFVRQTPARGSGETALDSATKKA